jgi:hypothetical protein
MPFSSFYQTNCVLYEAFELQYQEQIMEKLFGKIVSFLSRFKHANLRKHDGKLEVLAAVTMKISNFLNVTFQKQGFLLTKKVFISPYLFHIIVHSQNLYIF